MVWAPESLFGRHLPLVVLTGFLGSGKTTLLNRLLRDGRLADSAIIVNEFGSVSVDHALIEAPAGDVFALPNGCMCCFASDDLYAALSRVFEAERAGTAKGFRRVIIETSGLADPEAVIQSVTDNPVFGRFLWLDRLVTTVDAQYGLDQLSAHPEALKQARLADRLVLTKTDLVEPAAVEAAVAGLRAANPYAVLHEGVDAAVGLGELLSPAFLDPGRQASFVGAWAARQPGLVSTSCRCEDPTEHAPGCTGHGHLSGRHHHRHPGAEVVSVVLTAQAPLDWRAFHLWLTGQQRRYGASLLRVKGLVRVEGTDRPIVIHAVRTTMHVPVELNEWPAGTGDTHVVFILKDGDGAALERDWRRFVGTPQAAALTMPA